MNDRPWSRRKVSDLIHGAHVEEDRHGRHFLVEGFSAFEARCKAYDTGVPDVAFDAFQLENSIDQITDLPVKAAVTLRLMGWDPLDIAAVLHDRKHRPATTLLEQGMDRVLRTERLRKASAEGADR